jgi:hypothetical protein
MLDAEKVLNRLKGGSLDEAFQRFNRDVLQRKPETNSSPFQPTPDEVRDERAFREVMMTKPKKEKVKKKR